MNERVRGKEKRKRGAKEKKDSGQVERAEQGPSGTNKSKSKPRIQKCKCKITRVKKENLKSHKREKGFIKVTIRQQTSQQQNSS